MPYNRSLNVDLPDAPRILITRLSAVGDCIHTLPLLAALRKHLPQAHIAWAVHAGPATLLAGNPHLDQVIRVERRWLKSPRRIAALRRYLVAQRFDVSLDPQSLTKSAALGWLAAARSRIGFARPQGREISLLLNNHLVRPQQQHVVLRYLELTRPLGLEPSEVTFDVPVDHAAEGQVDEFIRNTHLTNGFVVLNPGAGWNSKLWPVKRYGQLAKHLGQVHHLPSVVSWAGNQELQWARQIVAQSGGNAWLAPSTTLPQLAALLRRARFFVGSDTGPLHLAAAVGTPCIGMYGPTLPSECGPYGSQHLVLQKFFQHSRTSRQRRSAGNHAMQAIETADLCAACDQMVQRTDGKRRVA